MSDVTRAACWMVGAIVSFTVMAMAGRAVSPTLDTFEIMFYRSLIGIVIVTGILTVTGNWFSLNKTNIPLHVGRNIAHFTGQNLWFYALTLIPLAQVFALEFTTPIWVILLAPIFLGERLRAVQIGCALLGFIGILIVARPGTTPINAGMIAAASSAIGFAVTMIFTKRLTKTAGIGEILFFLTALQALFGLICAGYDGDIALLSVSLWAPVFLIGIAGLVAHYSITRALKTAPATIVAPIDFARLPIIAFIGYLFYQEPIDVWVFVGAGAIFVGNYVNLLFQTHDTAVTRR